MDLQDPSHKYCSRKGMHPWLNRSALDIEKTCPETGFETGASAQTPRRRVPRDEGRHCGPGPH